MAASSSPPMTQLTTPTAPPASPQQPTEMIVDRTGTRLSNDAAVLVPASADPSRGADEAFKRRGPNDLYLVPLASALAREQAANRIGSRLRVLVGKEVGYRVLIEALFTAAQNQIGEFELCEEVCGPRSLGFRPPRTSEGRDVLVPPKTLNLTALIVGDGVALKTSKGNIAPGCNDVGKGLAIPKRDGAHDLPALVACAQKLEASDPAFANEEDVIISANPATPFSEVMDVALALQGPTKTLFSRVTFGVSK